jgi:hypothetical protein
MPWLAAEPTLVIIVRARELRRRVGLTAWAALEELLFEATPHAQGGGASVKVSRAPGCQQGHCRSCPAPPHIGWGGTA